MIRINLLAAERPTTQKKKATGGGGGAPGGIQAYLLLGLFAGGALAVCVGLWLLKSASIRDLEAKIKEQEATKIRLQAIKKQVDELQAKEETLKQKVKLIEELKAAQGGPVHMLDELSKALPDFVWLTAMEQTGDKIKLSGQSNSLASIAEFMSRLQETKWFATVDLVSSVEEKNLVTFSLLATFRNLEAEKAKAAQQAAAPPAEGGAPGAPSASPVAPAAKP
jgi:type IV pilus assembly protein PilN